MKQEDRVLFPLVALLLLLLDLGLNQLNETYQPG